MIPAVPDLGTMSYATAELCEPAPAGTLLGLGWQPRWEYVLPQNADATTSEYSGLTSHLSKVKALASDKSLLPFGAPSPTEVARFYAQFALSVLANEDLSPDRVVASAEGGIALCFEQNDNYADIECLNSGEILGVISNRRDHPNVWEIEPSPRSIASAAARIREFITA